MEVPSGATHTSYTRAGPRIVGASACDGTVGEPGVGGLVLGSGEAGAPYARVELHRLHAQGPADSATPGEYC